MLEGTLDAEQWPLVVFAREEFANLVTAAISTPHFRVSSRTELAILLARRRPCIAFVDLELISQLDPAPPGVTIVGVARGGVSELVEALLTHPSVLHVVSTTMLASPQASQHLADVCERIQHGPEHAVLRDAGIGRAALLASSERRAQRLERIADFFAAHGISAKTIEMMNDVAEELITNALYDAPHEAGWFGTPVPRTAAVELPPEHACEISYGIQAGRVFVRVRDPFGALTQRRLFQVLDRCRTKDVQFDESRGGAGLGMWRVFSAASTLVVSVIPGRLTDILVWVDANNRRPAGKLHTAQLSFPDPFVRDGVAGRFAADHDFDLMDESFTAVIS